MIKKRIKILINKFKKYKIDGYVVPKNDEFFTEYSENDRLKNYFKFFRICWIFNHFKG